MPLETPLQSVRIRPVISTLPWSQAQTPGTALTTVNLTDPIDVTAYAARDFELAYRDVVLMSLVSELSITVGEIFGADITRPAIQAAPTGALAALAKDRTAVAMPGAVTHVGPSSVPAAAHETDRQLYARDLLLHEALVEVAQILETPTVESLVTTETGDNWSLAEGRNERASVNGAIPLSVDLFKAPDRELTDRDNSIAAAIANIAYELNDIYALATRLHVQVSDPGGLRDAELYVLKSDDGRYRKFVAMPGLTDRNQVVYDKLLRTVEWYGESAEDTGVSAFAGRMALPFTDAELVLKASQTSLHDSKFWRQKSKRLVFNTYKTLPLYYQSSLSQDISSIDSAVFQPVGIYLPSTDTAVTLTPTLVNTPSVGHYRLAVYFEPSRVARLYGSLNLNGVTPDDSENATLASGGALLNWQLKLLEGRYTVRFRFADNTASTDNFTVKVLWNTSVVFEGFLLYGKDAETFVYSNSYVVATDGEIGSFTIQRTDFGSGSLTIGVVEFTNIREGNLSCTVLATMDDVEVRSVFSSQSGRPDTLFFDFFSTTPGTIRLLLEEAEVGGIYIRAIDIRKFGSQRETPNAVGYRKWKRTYIENALEAVRRAFKLSTPDTGVPEFANATVWDTSATESWISFIAALEPNLTSAFRVGRPGDIGQPALTPSGIYFDIENRVIRQLDPADSFPTMQAFQPWMLAAGIFVFHQDFWIEEFWPNAPIADCDFITADFGIVPLGDEVEVPVPEPVVHSGSIEESATLTDEVDASIIPAPVVEVPYYLWGWGSNFRGMLGLGTTTEEMSPILSGITAKEVVQIGTSSSNAIIRKENGTIWGAGRNVLSELGIPGNAAVQYTFVQVGLGTNDWAHISRGGSNSNHFGAIKTNGTLWTWGYNWAGQLGQGFANNDLGAGPVQVGTDTDWATVNCGRDHTLALKNDGSLWSWGRNNYSQIGRGIPLDGDAYPTPVQIGSGFTQISAGYEHSMGIKDGNLYVWGKNAAIGQLPAGVSNTTNSPLMISAEQWINIGAGWDSCFAIKADGTLWSTGFNFTGQLGLGDTTYRQGAFYQVGTDTDWVKVDFSLAYTVAKKSNGTLWAWGDNDSAQLGQGTSTGDSYSPIQVGTDTNWIDFTLTEQTALALKNY